MSMQVCPGRVVDRATPEEAAYARGVAEGRVRALAEVSWVPESYLRLWAEGMGDVPKPEYTDTNTNPGAYLLQEAARAELARRGES